MNDDDLDLLRFEKLRWNYPGAKATAVRKRFGLTLTGYWQRLFALCERPEALAAEPVIVNRINRRRRRGRLGDVTGTAECAEPRWDVTG